MESKLNSPKLSICIATFNRGKFIGETLDSILGQIEDGVELIVVDGASPDETPVVMEKYLLRNPNIRYYREEKNSGVDCDYDKAVGYASGDYCWLMPDDDLLTAGATSRVLKAINGSPELIVVNSELWNADFTKDLKARMLNSSEDKIYDKEDGEKVFTETASCLSYIGSVVVKRSTWLERDRSSYYGTLFIHVGVIFQHPAIKRVKVIADPLIAIRYCNGMWTPRGFEIWNFKWPQLIWAFPDFSDRAKQQIVRREPWRQPKTLFYARAIGAYSLNEFREFLSSNLKGVVYVLAYVISVFPAKWANFVVVLCYSAFRKTKQKSAEILLFDLLQCRHSTVASKLLARAFGIKFC